MKNFEEKLYNEFPDFFDRTTHSPSGERGFEIGGGWYELVRQMVLELQAQSLRENRSKDNMVKCNQCKSKFGILRVYLINGSDEMRDIVTKYQDESINIPYDC